MPRLKLAVATRCFQQPLRRAIRSAAECGAQGIQLDARHELPPSALSQTGQRQFLKHLRDARLDVASLNLHLQRSLYDQQYLDERLTLIRQTMELAYRMRSSVVTARVGTVPQDRESPDYRLLLDVLNDLARHGNHVGAVLGIIPSNDPPDDLSELIRRVTEGPMGIDFDPPAFLGVEQTIESTFRILHPFVVHVQARDAIRGVDGAMSEVAMGHGDVPWDALLALLDETDYAGWMTVVRTTGPNQRDDTAHAVGFLRSMAMR